MKQEQVFAIIRHLLSAVGAYLIGRSIFGVEATNDILEAVSGCVMTLVAIVWSIRDKTITIEKIQGAVRHVLIVIGGIGVARGWMTNEGLETIISFAAMLLPMLAGRLSKQKSQQIAQSAIDVRQLKGVRPKDHIKMGEKAPVGTHKGEPDEPRGGVTGW